MIFVLITVFAIAATVMTFFNLAPFRAHPWYHLAYWLTGYAVLVATAPAVLVWQERIHGGRLPVDRLLTGTLALDDINRGFDLLHEGKAVRQVVLL